MAFINIEIFESLRENCLVFALVHTGAKQFIRNNVYEHLFQVSMPELVGAFWCLRDQFLDNEHIVRPILVVHIRIGIEQDVSGILFFQSVKDILSEVAFYKDEHGIMCNLVIHKLVELDKFKNAEVQFRIWEYLPFLATENIMMEAVKRGGDRQELHEKIRQHSMAATARMKEGESCDLLDRLAADPAFGMTRAELDAVMEPSLYIGRCKEQVERLLAEYAPLLADAQTADGAISL